MGTLKLRKFDPRMIGDDKVCLFIGKRGTGKSTLVTDILYHKRKIPYGIVMSATEEGNHYYKNYIPDLFVHNGYDKGAIERVIESQKAKLNKYGKADPVFILIDDCMYDKSFLKDDCIRSLFMNGRHWKIFFLMTAQYCMDLPPGLRTNIDYVFCLRENVIQNREKLYKSFFGVFQTLHIFQQVMDACTENYECIVLDNTSKSNNIEDCVFYYKARVMPPFRMGCEAWWRYHQRNYNPKYGQVEQPSKIQKRGPSVQIKKL